MFKIAQNKNLGRNSTKNQKDLCAKKDVTLIKKTECDLKKWKDISCSQIGN